MSSAAPDVAAGGAEGAGAIRSRTWRLVGFGAAGVLLALATWHVPSIVPYASLDDSWRIALHLAATHGLDYGRQILFTYGPLGFLSVPMPVTVPTGIASFVYVVVAQVALALVVFASARRSFGWLLALPLAYVALNVPLLLSDIAVYGAFFACIWVLERERPPGQWWLSAAAGVLAGAELLIKLNGGIVCLVLLAFAVWRIAPGGLRSEGILLGTFAVSLVVLWLATGNPLGELPAWLRESSQIVSGYTDAMALELARHREDAMAAVLAAGWAVLLALRKPRRLPVLLATLVFAFAYFKEGFVRHDGHDVYFFSAVGLGVLAFRWPGKLRYGAAAVVVGAAAAVVLSPEYTFSTVYHPVALTRIVVDEARDTFEPGRRRRAIASWKAFDRSQLGVPASELPLLRGHTVDVVPYATAAVWAYGLRWQPELLLQWYMAYNAYLDRLNASRLASHGAERVLRERTFVVDGKEPDFEAPATYVALVCNYRELAADTHWEVLARTRNRCGTEQKLSTVRATSGQTIPIPQVRSPGEMVVARIHFPSSLTGALVSAVFKPLTPARVTLDGSADYRFIPETGSGPLVLRMAPDAGMSPFFGGAASYRTLTLHHVPSPFTVRFDAIPVRGTTWKPAPAGAGRLEPGAVVLGKRRYPIVANAVRGSVDTGQASGEAGLVTGWAAGGSPALPAKAVAVFADGRLVAETRPNLSRPDVAAAIGSPGAVGSGYGIAFRLPPGTKTVRVFAVADGEASELPYSAQYAWPHS